MRVIRLVGFGLSLIALGLLLGSSAAYQSVSAFAAHAHVAEAQIVGHDPRSDVVFVRFTTAAGQPRALRESADRRWPPPPVQVLYGEDRAVINDVFALWGRPFILALLGSASLALAGLLLLVSRSPGRGGSSPLGRLTPPSRAYRLGRRWLVEVPARCTGFGLVGAGAVAHLGLWVAFMVMPSVDDRTLVASFPAILSAQLLLLVTAAPLALADGLLPEGPSRPFDAALALDLLTDPLGDDGVRRKVLRAVVRHDPRDVVPHLLRWLEHEHVQVRRVAARAFATVRWRDEGTQRRALALAGDGRYAELVALSDRSPREVLAALRVVALRFGDPAPDLGSLIGTFLMFGYTDGAAVLRQNLPAAVGPVSATMRAAIDQLEGPGPRGVPCPSLPPS